MGEEQASEDPSASVTGAIMVYQYSEWESSYLGNPAGGQFYNYINQQPQGVMFPANLDKSEALQFVPQTPRGLRLYWNFLNRGSSPYDSMLATLRIIYKGDLNGEEEI